MDRPRRASRLNWLAAFAAVALLGASAPAPILLRAQVWTAPGPALAHDLAHAPAECLARGGNAREIEIGRALFRSPALLGGPAARLGLSCNACHINGQANARFLLPELTDRAGAADVTSEWSSKVRGDGLMNPRDIPNLTGVGARGAYGAGRDPSLEHFVRGVIVEEFQGAPPSADALSALTAYLRALDPSACADVPVTLASASADVRRALAAAAGAQAPTASLLVLAAQDEVGRIVERLPQPRFNAQRAELQQLAYELGAWRSSGGQAALAAAGPGWSARFDAIIARLSPHERETYFHEPTLAAALAP